MKFALVDAESRRGNCLDNAAMESWNSSLKTELGERFASNADAKAELFDYIEVFYNQQRRHSSLGYVSPAECERVARGLPARGGRAASSAAMATPGRA